MELMHFLLRPGQFFSEVYDYIVRVEYQGRGTLHIHVCAWLEYAPRWIDPISGRNLLHGRAFTERTGPLVDYLYDLLHCNIDAQCGGLHPLYMYLIQLVVLLLSC